MGAGSSWLQLYLARGGLVSEERKDKERPTRDKRSAGGEDAQWQREGGEEEQWSRVRSSPGNGRATQTDTDRRLPGNVRESGESRTGGLEALGKVNEVMSGSVLSEGSCVGRRMASRMR